MIYWLTENSTVPMVTGVILTLIFMGLAFSSREKVMVYIAIGIGGLTFCTVLCERLYVTEQEEVTSILSELADFVATNNTNGIVGYVAAEAEVTKQRVISDMGRATFESCRVIGTNYFAGSQPGKNEAEICFAVSVSGSSQEIGGTSFGQFKVTVNFIKDKKDKWKIVDYQVESPLAGVSL